MQSPTRKAVKQPSCPWAASISHALAVCEPACVEPDPRSSRLHSPCNLHAAAHLQAAVGSSPPAPSYCTCSGQTASTQHGMLTPRSRCPT